MPTWVILPTYDEAENLEPLVHAVLAALPGVRVLVVDDSSPDGTGEIADALAAARDDVEVIHRPRKSGLGRAYVAGFEHALRAGRGHGDRDGRRLLARPGRPATPARLRGAAAPTSRSARATSPAAA